MTRTTISIEPCPVQRLDEIRELLTEYAAFMAGNSCFIRFDSELASLPGEYAPPTGGLLAADDAGVLAGCVALRELADGVCEMKRLYVRPHHRGRGLGRRLAVAIIDSAIELKYRLMRLDTLPVMREAIGTYRSLGFVDIPPYYAKPIPGAICMELNLSCRPRTVDTDTRAAGR